MHHLTFVWSEAGRGIQEVELQEPQSPSLSNRFEILAPCVDCREDEQTDHGTVIQRAVQVGEKK